MGLTKYPCPKPEAGGQRAECQEFLQAPVVDRCRRGADSCPGGVRVAGPYTGDKCDGNHLHTWLIGCPCWGGGRDHSWVSSWTAGGHGPHRDRGLKERK